MEKNHEKKEMIWKLLAVIAIVGLLSVTNALAAEETISGTVENSDNGIVITADDGQTYAVQGQDLSAMVGKTVRVTGTLEESKSGPTITVVKVEEITKMNK